MRPLDPSNICYFNADSSLLISWITVFAWTFAVSAVLVSPSIIIQGIVSFWNTSYEAKTWPTTLIMWVLMLCAILCNLHLRRLLNVLEILGGIVHFLAWVSIIIILTMLGERSSTDFVFKNVVFNVSRWKNPALCFQIGLLGPLAPLSGSDSILHMSEFGEYQMSTVFDS